MTPSIPQKHKPHGIDFLYEDRDIIVICKESGILTTETRRHETFTAVNAVSNYLRKGCTRSSKRALLVHRLDRETSGVLLFAKSEEAQEAIKENWKANEKIYVALVRGSLSGPKKLLKNYLAEDEDLFMRVVRGEREGKLCSTEYEPIWRGKGATAVRVRLLTGRKNQIRVQFAHINHPILGDEKYGWREEGERRLFLHAHSLAIDHPRTGERLVFTAPIPHSFQKRLGEPFEVEPAR